MDWKRGLFRMWLVVSGCWLIGVLYLSSNVFFKPLPFRGDYQNVGQTKEMPWNTDWSKPYYETHFAPTKGNFPESFAPVDEGNIAEWDVSAKNGKMIIVSFPDHSTLYLSSELTKPDQELLSKLFWEERSWRIFAKIRPWLLWALMPPMTLLLTAATALWVVRGFRQPKHFS